MGALYDVPICSEAKSYIVFLLIVAVRDLVLAKTCCYRRVSTWALPSISAVFWSWTNSCEAIRPCCGDLSLGDEISKSPASKSFTHVIYHRRQRHLHTMIYTQDHDREEQAPQRGEGQPLQSTMLGQGSPIVWETKRSTRSADWRRLEERTECGFRIRSKIHFGAWPCWERETRRRTV